MTITLKNYLKEQRIFNHRIIVVIGLVALLSILLIVRLFYLQIIQHKYYVTLSQKNYLELLPIEPNRGLIYDRNGVLLAENIPTFSLDITPNQVKDLSKSIEQLRSIVSLDDSDIKHFYTLVARQPNFFPISLKLNLSEEDVARFSVNQYRFPGIAINAQMIRHYPLSEITTHVVGYVGRISENEITNLDKTNYSASNFIGKTGIEKYYEAQLHGSVGFRQVEVDATGHIIRTANYLPPVSGSNIYLTLDNNIQKIAEEALGKECGAIVAIIPKTGEVLALVSNPSFDPNLFAQGISTKDLQKLHKSLNNPLYNRATRGQFPMASTIKPYMAIAGLNYGVISPNYSIMDHGWFKLPNSTHIYRDWDLKWGGHGVVNVTKAIIVSSDPFFYNLAVLLTIERIDNMLSRFGFGEKTGIDMPDEADGIVPSPEWKMQKHGVSWFPGDTVISGIGQGFMLATPLQLAQAVTIIANRGIRVQPRLLLGTQVQNEQLIKINPIMKNPVVLKNSNIWKIVIKAMQGVITSVEPWGTGRNSFGYNLPYSIAAKTGTAQVYSKHGRTEDASSDLRIPKKLRNHSLFIAFAPIDDPKIAIAVIVEHNGTAGSIARKVMDYYLLNKSKT